MSSNASERCTEMSVWDTGIPVKAAVDTVNAAALVPALATPLGQSSADVELVPVRIHNGHAPQTLKALIRRLLHCNTVLPELVEPRIDVGHVQVNQAAQADGLGAGRSKVERCVTQTRHSGGSDVER